MKPIAIYAIVAAAALFPAQAAFAQDKTRAGDIYGSQLMTFQERNDYRARMRAAASAEERERIRAEHHDRMKERAQARGVTLPDEPPAGRGPGSAAGGTRGGR